MAASACEYASLILGVDTDHPSARSKDSAMILRGGLRPAQRSSSGVSLAGLEWVAVGRATKRLFTISRMRYVGFFALWTFAD